MYRRRFTYLILFSANQILLCIIAITILVSNSQAQTQKIDSLKKKVALAIGNAQKSDALQALCEESSSMNIDTLFHYASLLKQIAIASADEKKIIQANIVIETWLGRKNLLDSALQICNRDLKKITYANPGDIYAKVNMQKCYVLMKLNKREETLAYTYHFLNEAENRQDTVSQIYCKYIIGCVYRSMQQTDQALQWFYKAANTGIENIYDEKKNSFAVFLQIGGMYNWKAVADSAQKDITADSAASIYFLDKTIAYSRKNENISVLARALCMKADALEDPKHMALAGSYLKEAIQIYDQLHDTLSILNGITAMSDYYLSSGQADKGIASCIQGIEIVNRGFAYPLAELYWTLAQCYKKADNNIKYAETLNLIIDLNNATYKKNSEQDLAELNAKYELSNKEAFIAKQKLELLHKNLWIGTGAIIALLIAAIAYLLFRRNRRRQRVALLDAEEKERKRIAADLHDNIGAYAAAISAGLDEMESRKLITDISSIHNLKNNVTEIITSLRDTIWAFNKDSITLTGISDRIKIFIQKIQPAYPQVSINLEEDIDYEKKLSPVQALHVFRIVQEALHNALQHSRCNKIFVSINSNIESTAISIEDNGEGFDPESVQNAGNGLMNMKSRATETGFNLEFAKIFPNGTKVLLLSKNNKK